MRLRKFQIRCHSNKCDWRSIRSLFV